MQTEAAEQLVLITLTPEMIGETIMVPEGTEPIATEDVRRCPFCEQSMIAADLHDLYDDADLTDDEARLLQAVWDGKGRKVIMRQIFELMLANDFDANVSINAAYKRFNAALPSLNVKIRPLGAEIVSLGPRKGYRLAVNGIARLLDPLKEQRLQKWLNSVKYNNAVTDADARMVAERTAERRKEERRERERERRHREAGRARWLAERARRAEQDRIEREAERERRKAAKREMREAARPAKIARAKIEREKLAEAKRQKRESERQAKEIERARWRAEQAQRRAERAEQLARAREARESDRDRRVAELQYVREARGGRSVVSSLRISDGDLARIIEIFEVTAKPARLLKVLWEAKGNVLKDDRIAAAMYEGNPAALKRPPKLISKSLRRVLFYLRQRVEGSGVVIENVGKGKGYRLVRNPATESRANPVAAIPDKKSKQEAPAHV